MEDMRGSLRPRHGAGAEACPAGASKGPRDEDGVEEGARGPAATAASKGPWDGLKREAGSLGILLLLYTLQGVPMGLSSSIPVVLVKKISWTHQAGFSLVTLPFSLKILWAPFVDAVFIERFGRRKTWLIPVQLAVGCALVLSPSYVDDWVGEKDDTVDIRALTIFFMALYFLMATQDVAVDGWALTMLSPENVPYASSVNTVGQLLGTFMTQTGFLCLSDETISNKYFRTEPRDGGLVTLSQFMVVWGYIFLLTTVLIGFFKREEPLPAEHAPPPLHQTYSELGAIVVLRPVRQLLVLLFTARAAFGATEAAWTLKLLSAGMTREHMALGTPLLVTSAFTLPLIVGRLVTQRKPLSVYMAGVPVRLAACIVGLVVLRHARVVFAGDEGERPWWATAAYFFPGYMLAVLLNEIGSSFMHVAGMGFFAKVSDPRVGGTYMTMLNTMQNLGSKWPMLVALVAMDRLRVQHCVDAAGGAIAGATCRPTPGDCESAGGTCSDLVDAFELMVVAGVVVGAAWLFLAWPWASRLQELPAEDWYVVKRTAGKGANPGKHE